ncbi:MAG: histidine phosphatase family protein [Cyanobacteriota bacterium]|nr:histidine phosphatase family protein [Cyanobacteriota bacterium]
MTPAADPLPSPGTVFLMRHGIAEPRGGATPEPLRALTPRGLRRTRAVAERLMQLNLTLDLLLSSPLQRARQTAELVVQAGLVDGLLIDEALAPGGDPWPLVEACGPRRLMLVGHEPDLGDLASRLLGAPVGAIRLKKAGLAVISLGPSPCLRSLWAPAGLLAAASATAPV